MSSSRNAQPPLHSASLQSTSAHDPNQIISKMPGDHQARVLAAELLTFFANLKVVTPHELLSESFPNKEEWDRVPRDTIKYAFRDELAHYNLKFIETQSLYECLRKAFDTCCDEVTPVASVDNYVPANNLHCENTSKLRPNAEDLSGDPSRQAPDLCLTFDVGKYSSKTFFSRAMVTLEFKSSVIADPGFTAIALRDSSKEQKKDRQLNEVSQESLVDSSKERKRDLQLDDVSGEALAMVLQAFGYVSAQWAERPYRHVWSITIACDLMRIWKWSASGVLVTEAFNYLSDATPIYQFLQAIGKGPYSRLGLDVGHDMTFGTVQRSKVRKGVSEIIKAYGYEIKKSTMHIEWVEKALESDIWSFKQPSSTRLHNRTVTAQTLTDKGKNREEQNETTTQTTKQEPQTDVVDIETLYVVSHPIWRGKGVYSRGTRCYLAVYDYTLEGREEGERDLPYLCVEDAHMLKTSWQFLSSSPEYTFFHHIQDKNSGPVPHLASMIAGGSIESTKRQEKRLVVAERKPTTANDEKEYPRGRHIQWILFKQVGERISGFHSAKELLQTVYDAVVAHESLYQAGVLHGDISENNILIDLVGNNDKNTSTRRGLLIDLDMAHSINSEELRPAGSDSNVTDDVENFPDSDEDFDFELSPDPEPEPVSGQKPPRTKLTGTLLFMSIAKKSQPRHKCWHDLESFFWLLLFVTLRHVPGVVVKINTQTYNLDDATQREQILQLVFRPQALKNALIDFSDSKDTFIRARAKITVEGNSPFTILMRELYGRLGAQYSVFYDTTTLTTDLQDIGSALNGHKIVLPLQDIYMASGAHEFKEQLFALLKAEEKISSMLKRLGNARDIAKAVSSKEEGQLTEKELAARNFVQEMNVSAAVCNRQQKELVNWRRQMSLHRDSNQELEFPSHKWLKEQLLEAIGEQEEISPVPSRPFNPKPIENAVRALRSGVSKLVGSESGSGDMSYFIDRSASASASGASGASRGASSAEPEQAGQKRKRSAKSVRSSTKEKRQKKMHEGNGSSGPSAA